MRIGFNRHRDEDLFGIKWKRGIKVLGIHFSSEALSSSLDENWAAGRGKVQRMITSWSRRALSISGRICIVTSLLLSQFIHTFQALVAPDHVLTQLNAMLF